jgi:RNA polymerase sigma-70 factor (ECF subfamily)
MDAFPETLVTTPSQGDAPGSDLGRLALAARAGRGAEEERLWQAAYPRLVRIALALGVPAGDVPDLVQDALFAAHRALRRFDPGAGSFEAWLGTILIRRARNLARSRRRRRVFLDALRAIGLPVAPRSPQALERLEARLVVERLIGCLSVSQRDVVALYEIGEMDAAESARILGLTPAGVRSIARDARRRLAEEARLPAGAGKKRP